jgi:hypothetical protein
MVLMMKPDVNKRIIAVGLIFFDDKLCCHLKRPPSLAPGIYEPPREIISPSGEVF